MAATGAAVAAGTSSSWLPWLLGGSAIGSSLLGGLMGSKGSGDQSREASRRSIELNKNQAGISSQLMTPYTAAGNLAMQKLWGYGPTGQGTAPVGGSPGATTGGTTSIPYLTPGSTWKSPSSINYAGYGETGPAFDRTGGAGQYIPKIQDLLSSFKMPGTTTQKYMDQLEGYGQNFKFNPDDPAYKYKTEESSKSINKALAGRGLFDSRAGVNMLTDADRAITADEYDKQYGRGYQTVSDLFKFGTTQDAANLQRSVGDYDRQYGGLQDLFKMTGSMGETGYQSLLDAVKVGSGAGATAGSLGNSAAANLTSAYGQMSQAGAMDDANKASLWSGIGAMPMNAMLLYQLLSK